jgi:hypothetical protein
MEDLQRKQVCSDLDPFDLESLYRRLMVSTVDFKVDSSFKYLSSWAVIYSIPAASPSFLPS